MDIRSMALECKQYVIDRRREFHMYPEISWNEVNTSNRIKKELEKMNIPYIPLANTGIVATIQGNEKGKCVGLRADMDALEVTEANDVIYKSKNEGVMHACGHDGHIAMLLGAAQILNRVRDRINGSVKLIFQPAEEIIQGAKKMIDEGVLEGLDSVFAIHLWNDLDSGKISVEEGPRTASGDRFKIYVRGKSGHGARPHQAVDALLIASSIVMNMQSIVSREVSPLDPAVVSIGILNSGTRFNVIPSDAVLEGTARCYNPDLSVAFPKMIQRIVTSIAKSYRGEAELEYIFGSPPSINDAKCSKIAAKSAETISNKEAVVKFEKLTVGEDFSYFLERVPGVLAFVGTGLKDKSKVYPHHHGKFDIDENALEIGTALYAQYALDFLNS